MKLLRCLRNSYLRLSATSYGHLTKHVEYCDHCGEHTAWAVRILSGYVRCLECGRNPWTRDDAAPSGKRSSFGPAVESRVPG